MQKVFEKAQSIWENGSDIPNQYAWFLHKFELRNLENVVLNISVDNRYTLYINGNLLNAQQYADYPFYKVYDSITLPKEFLNKGENVLKILAYSQNGEGQTYYKGFPSLIFEIAADDRVISYSDHQTLSSNKTGYQNGVMDKFTFQLSYSFYYDAVLAEKYEKDMGWHESVIVQKSDRYYKRPIEQLKVGDREDGVLIASGEFLETMTDKSMAERAYTSFLKPFTDINDDVVLNSFSNPKLPSANGITLETKAECSGVFAVVDMLKEQAGYFELELNASEPCEIFVSFGEHLEDLRVRSVVVGRHFTFGYKAKKGINKFYYPTKRIGARYLQLHIYSKSCVLHYAGVRSADYPLLEKDKPEGLSFFRQKIYDIGVDTLRRCMHEHYEDCPWREQALYTMDSRNQMLFSYEAFEDGIYDYVKANLRLLGINIRPDGMLELCAPASIPETIPCFSLMWIVELSEYCCKVNDTEFAVEMLPFMETVIEMFTANLKGDLLYNFVGYWGFYEWQPYLNGVSENGIDYCSRNAFDAPFNAFYALALKSASKIYRLIGDIKKADYVDDIYKKLKAEYNKIFYSSEKKAYFLTTDKNCPEVYSQLVQALTICAGLCPDEQIEKNLAERLLGDEFTPKATLSHSMFVYQAMMKFEELHQKILDDIDMRWGNMLMNGATTFWETELGAADFNRSGSLCHGWSAIPVYFYRKLISDKIRMDISAVLGE